MIDSAVAERILGSRAVATGAPDGDSLENVNTTTLDDGARCYVIGGDGAGEWQFNAASSTTADGTTVVEPLAGGAGRWFKRSAPTDGSASSASAQYAILGTAATGATLPITESLDGFGFGIASNVVTVPSVGRYKISFAANLQTTSPDAILYVSTWAGVQLTSVSTTSYGAGSTDVGLAGVVLVDIADPATQGISLRNASAPGNNFSSAASAMRRPWPNSRRTSRRRAFLRGLG